MIILDRIVEWVHYCKQHMHIFFVLSDITIVTDVLHLWETIWYKVSLMCHVYELFHTCYCSYMYIYIYMRLYHYSIVYNLFNSIHFLLSHVYVCVCASFDALERNSIVYLSFSFYGLKLCAANGRTNFLILLSSRCIVHARSTDGMSNENSLFLSLFRSRYNNP
jgi:hypothetical protein